MRPLAVRWALLAACALFAPRAQAQDGGALVQKMVAVYGSLKSYSHNTSSTVYQKSAAGTRSQGSTAQVRVARPNRVYLNISSPQMGANVFHCDGREAVVYNAKLNQYVKAPAPASLSLALGTLNRNARDTFGFQVSAVLDPLFFLQGGKSPNGVSWSTRKGLVVLDGAQCYQVDGFIPTRGSKQVTGMKVSLWIDRDSSLLHKVEILISGVPTVTMRRTVKDGKPAVERVAGKMDQTMVERITDIRVNPPLNDQAFQFVPPRGAVERNLIKALGK